jgi:DNA invertase Pin-like site-specific DNA recombinase
MRWGSIGRRILEIESGRRNDRPRLAEALTACTLHRATLIIARLDRLARNVAFVSNLMEAGVDFEAVDFPQANRLTIYILSAVAEAKMISDRTRNALAAAKSRGTRLGGFRGCAGIKKRSAYIPRYRALDELLARVPKRATTILTKLAAQAVDSERIPVVVQ